MADMRVRSWLVLNCKFVCSGFEAVFEISIRSTNSKFWYWKHQTPAWSAYNYEDTVQVEEDILNQIIWYNSGIAVKKLPMFE